MILYSELAHIDLSICCNLASDLKTRRSFGVSPFCHRVHLGAPWIYDGQGPCGNNRSIFDVFSGPFVLISEVQRERNIGVSDDGLQNLSFD